MPVWRMLSRYGRTGKDTQATQLIFCDLSTPKTDGTFNVYDDVKKKLVERGIPKEEIAFIHEYNTEVKKAELFAKVRAGQVRILIGSTPKSVLVPTCRTDYLPCIIWTALGNRLTWNSRRDVLSDRETRMKR